MNVTICSRKAASELLRTDTLSRTAVISLLRPTLRRQAARRPRWTTPARRRVFTVVVHDLDLTALPDVGGLDCDTYMPEADALAAFICQGKGGRLDILCQCEYGQSPQRRLRRRPILEYFNWHRHLRLCRLPLLPQPGGVSQGHGCTDKARHSEGITTFCGWLRAPNNV